MDDARIAYLRHGWIGGLPSHAGIRGIHGIKGHLHLMLLAGGKPYFALGRYDAGQLRAQCLEQDVVKQHMANVIDVESDLACRVMARIGCLETELTVHVYADIAAFDQDLDLVFRVWLQVVAGGLLFAQHGPGCIIQQPGGRSVRTCFVTDAGRAAAAWRSNTYSGASSA